MKSRSANLSWKGGGEGFGKFDYKFYKSKQPNVVDSFDKKHINIFVWCFANKTCKSDRGTCPRVRPLEAMRNQDCNSRGKKK